LHLLNTNISGSLIRAINGINDIMKVILTVLKRRTSVKNNTIISPVRVFVIIWLKELKIIACR